jgi:GGDEF domain-containing protein
MGAVASFHDETELFQHKAQLEQQLSINQEVRARLEYLAHMDEATGLLNQRQFERLYNGLLTTASTPFVTVQVEVKNMRALGLRLEPLDLQKSLDALGKNLKSRLDPRALIGRIDGNQFAVALANLSDLEAKRVCKEIEKCFEDALEGREQFQLEVHWERAEPSTRFIHVWKRLSERTWAAREAA